ncbi:hypothetical protein CERSUDRAFT_110395 [Gelatoporia subvermispora B]|uniref:PHD-type domain-containing protein n=1 Tax=Ceriporiopsis subvermispora (strain B) TaxID=914234 RepID=M2RSC5_CERS8|nr:hypothetical protein CERSUDRAFT_110395 [Gelatoporia subvermispora B]
MSLPTIIHKTSPVLSPSGGDFGGLEALVQAATEERRRLSGEAGGAGLSRREVSPSTSRSPVLLRGSPHLEVPTQLYAPRSPTLLGVGQADLRLDGPDVRTNYSSPRSERGWDGEPAMKRRRTSGGDTRAIADSRYPISPVGSSTLSPQASTIPTMQFTRETSMGVLASPSDSIRRQPHSPRVVDVPTLGDSGKNRLTTADVADASQTGRDVVTKKSGTGHHKDRESGERKPSQEKKKRSEGSAVKKKEPKLAADQEVIKGDTRRAKETGMANQDPHEWLLEHYSTSSPRPPKRPLSPGDDKIRPVTSLPPERPPQTDATEENTKEAAEARTPSRPSVIKKKPKKLRSPTRTPSPLAILEQELDGAEASSPALGKLDDAEVNLELDLAISMTPDAGTTTRDDPMDLDVEDELLSLVDDGPRASYSRPAPKASPARPRAESAQPGKLSANTTPARPLAASRTGSERGSMPPPLAVSPAQAKNGTLGGPTKDEPTEGANTLNGAKKKDGAKKPPAKPKQPAKPKAKPAPSTTKPKAKGSKDTAPAAPSPAPGTLTAAIPPAALKGKKGSPLPGSGAMGHKRALSATITPARSRSASVMPGASVPPEVDGKGDQGKENTVDDKLYCVCKTNYDEDRVMIACDRCDEWYHTQCVNMPDLEVDLVDQFICPPCVQSNPHLSLSTTYKRRCLAGSKHPNPASPEACHKPARGILSKYCSDECGLAYMQARIDAWTGDKHRLWESVKDAEKREGIVVRAVAIAAPMNGITKPEDSSEPPAARPQSDLPVLEAVKASKTRIERELARLHDQLERLTWRRDQLKKNMEIVLWREKLVQLATARAEALDECGWDQRLCFGDEEYTEFGAGVLESYEEQGQDTKENGDAMEVDGATNEEGEWWCRGKRKCDRHLGWQKLRAGEVEFDKEAMEAAVLKLTTQEREIRKQIEDVTDPQARASATALSTSPLQLLNCKVDLVNLEPPIVKINGDTGKKGKKKKN